jgi:hypothetical protein
MTSTAATFTKRARRNIIVHSVGTMKINSTLKGVIVGVLSCTILEFGTIAVLAGFETEKIHSFYGVGGLSTYLLLLFIILFITALLGISIALGYNLTKKITLILSISIFVFIISAYGYFIWHRFNMY